MLFSTLLRGISADKPVKIVRSSDNRDIWDVALIDGTSRDYPESTLFFGYAEQLPGGVLPPQCVLAARPGTAVPAGTGSLALTDGASLFALFNAAKALSDASRGQGFSGELMDCAARSGAVEPMIDLAAARLGNSVVLLDADYKILAASTVFPIDDPLWAENIRQGYCSYEFISAVRELDAVKNARPTSDPVVVTCSASPLRKLSSKVFIGGSLAGIVLMLEKETPISAEHMRLLPVLSAAVGEAIARYAPYLIPGGTAYQRLLYDMLIGASPEALAPRVAALQFSPGLCALCVRQTRYLGRKHLRETAAELARRLPETRFTFHENGVAALVPLGDEPGLTDGQAAALAALARAEHLRVGVSNPFRRPEAFARRYAQARRALELAEQLRLDEPVARYQELSFYDLLSAAGGAESLGSYCHPALAVLSRYDHDAGTDLYHTLEAYLACGCSVKDTAERLFIHRNSLNYRLGRIRELTRADLGDADTRFLLAASYRVDHFSGRDA